MTQLTEIQIDIPQKIAQNFSQPGLHRIFRGGRGSAKTMSLAKMTAVRGVELLHAGRTGVILASRERLNSLDESSMEEIKTAIRTTPGLAAYYEIGEKFIRSRCGRIKYVFAGLRQNLDSIKSKSRILLNWSDEAETISDIAWQKLLPTLREDGVENWISFNPESPESATWLNFVENPPPATVETEINWRDNPWFPATLEAQRLDCLTRRPEIYDHIWEGAHRIFTDAQIFAGYFAVDDFEVTDSWHGPYYGLDFGFSQDPTAAVECWVSDNRLYVRREAGKIKLDIDDTPAFLDSHMPDLARHVVYADSARPESISYLKRHGIPRCEGVIKWSGSVEDGIEFMKTFDKIVIHPDCTETAREFRLYSYKIDRLTEQILPKIVDAFNHYIDAIRYALSPMIRKRGSAGMLVKSRHRRFA